MSFLWGQKKDYVSEVQKLREKQISMVTRQNPEMKALNSSGTAYEFDISTKFGTLTIHLLLPENFPEVVCQIRVMNYVQHPWCNSQGHIIGHHDLMYWNANVSLARVIQEIKQEFVRNPPTPLQGPPQQPPPQMNQQPINSVGTPPVQPVLSLQQMVAQQKQKAARVQMMEKQIIQTQSIISQPPPQPVKEPPQIHHTPALPVPNDFSKLLDSLSISELEELDKNPDSLNDLFESISDIKNLRMLRDDMLTSIEDVCSLNIAEKPKIEELNMKNMELRHGLEEQMTIYNELQERISTLASKRSVQSLILLLDSEITQLDNKVMDLVDDYRRSASGSDSSESEEEGNNKKKNMSVSKFSSKHRHLRQDFHLLSAKRERLLLMSNPC